MILYRHFECQEIHLHFFFMIFGSSEYQFLSEWHWAYDSHVRVVSEWIAEVTHTYLNNYVRKYGSIVQFLSLLL